MTSLVSVTSICLIIVLTSGNGVHEVSAQEYSDELVKFVAAISGHYTNAAQVEASNVQKEIVVNGRGVVVAKLSPLVVMYFDESYQGKVVRKSLGILSESSEGEIYMSLHNLTDYSKYSIDTTDYSRFQYWDVTETPYCVGVFTEAAPNEYTGNFGCLVKSPVFQEKESYYYYIATYTCTNLSLSPAADDPPEDNELVPSSLTKENSYSLPDYLLEGRDNFVDPCVTK